MEQPQMQQLLGLLDRIMDPVKSQLSEMNTKIDRMTAMAERVALHEASQRGLEDEVDKLKNEVAAQAISNAELRGRNSIISWILGLVGAPLAVMLIGAGIARLFGINLGG